MRLRAQLNLALAALFLIAGGVAALLVHRLLYDNARSEVVRNAGLILESATAIRAYTVDQVRPHLAPLLADDFLPQIVPAYAATQTLAAMRRRYPDFVYKEATVNATNPADEAAGWEVGVVQQMRQDATAGELVMDRYDESGRRHVTLARPIRIEQPECLACHSEPVAAPPTMIKAYGPARGFGWKLHQTVGAQIVSVPTERAEAAAAAVFRSFMSIQLAVFAVLFVALNLLLDHVVVRPVRRLALIATEASLGRAADFRDFAGRRDEIGSLADAFLRTLTGLRRAIGIMEKGAPPTVGAGTTRLRPPG
jgi:HAMP domain-containing protein